MCVCVYVFFFFFFLGGGCLGCSGLGFRDWCLGCLGLSGLWELGLSPNLGIPLIYPNILQS